uniref:Protein tyrosine phosphatase mitochondrial 1 n=1 Tax=Strigops habroptila TaxID=2489341 RepID=A0A672TPW9_STRHB
MVLAEALGAGAARLLFYPTLLYTAARAQLPGSRRPWFHRIDGAVLLGALPLRGRSRRLVAEENVRAVVTLNEEYETRFLCCSAQLHHWSPQEAIEAIAKIRPHILIRHKQVQVLETFHRNVIAGT